MVVIEAAVAAGILLHQHRKGKDRREAMRAEAEEDLRRRGWNGEGSQPSIPSTPGGLMPPTPQHPPRPTSAPPPSYAPAGEGGYGAEKRQDWQRPPPGYFPSQGAGGYQGYPPPQQQSGYGYPPQNHPHPQAQTYPSYGPPPHSNEKIQYPYPYPQHVPTFPPPNASMLNQSLPYQAPRVADGIRYERDGRGGDDRPYNERANTMPQPRYYGEGKRRSITPPPVYRP